MTAIAAMPTSTSVLELLASSAVRALALAGVVTLGLAAFRVKSTTARLFTWTAILYACLAMPLLQWMLPPVPIPAPAMFRSEVPRLSASAWHASSKATVALADEDGARATSLATTATSQAHSPSPPSLPSLSVSWSAIAAAIYFGVVLLLLARFAVGLAFGRRLLRASQPIDDPAVISPITCREQAMGLTSAPHVAESELISVPLTLGVLRPTILLPAGWHEWNDSKLDSVLAHELSHVARRDALTQRLSLLHRAIFWFSPLAWWLDRRLADLAEQASDEAALSCGADRKDYARTLLEFFEALHAAPGRVWWQGVAMAKAGQAEKRLERILNWKGSVAMRFQKSLAVVVLVLAVPLVYLVSSVQAASQSVPMRSMIGQGQTPAPRPAPAPSAQAEPMVAPEPDSTLPPEPTSPAEPPPALAPVAGGVAGGVRGGLVGGIAPQLPAGFAPVPPMSGFAPVPPLAPMSALPPVPRAAWYGQSSSDGSSARRYSYAYGYDNDQRFVIVSGNSNAVTMSGSDEDARHVQKLKKTISGDFIWFEREEKSYVIRDQATINRAKKLWAPQEELGKKQEELGAQQEALGKQQEELSAEMEQVHVNVPDLTAELDKLKAELKKLSSGATVEQVGEIQSGIGELQSKIGEVQSQAGDKQGNLSAKMSALGSQQSALGARQGELGRQQGELAREAARQMKQLLDEAIAKGIAQPEL